MELLVRDDAGSLARSAAEAIRRLLEDIWATDRRASLAVSGGSTPWATLAVLAGEIRPAERLEVYQVDERQAADGDPERNWTHALSQFCEPAQIPDAHRHPMPVLTSDREQAARDYAHALPAKLDVVVLGLGTDGHTASLIPGDPVCEVSGRPVAWTTHEERGHHRMTLTFDALAAAKHIVWLVSGEAKAPMLRRLVDRDPTIPAGRVEASRALVVCDRAAAAQLRVD